MKDKYKISSAAIDAAKKKDKKDLDKKEERFKQTPKDYPIVEIDNQIYTEGKLKQMIDTLSDSDVRKKHYKKILEEMKDMVDKKPDKELNKRKDTAYTKIDEILELHPIYKYDETEDIMTLDYPKMKASMIEKVKDKILKADDKGNLKGMIKLLEAGISKMFAEKETPGNIKIKEEIDNVLADLKSYINTTKSITAEGEILDPLPEYPALDLDPSAQPPDLPQEDVFDVGDGLPLGDGYMAHKDPEDGKIYVLDKEGNQTIKVQNAFINDMALVIEFFRDLLGLGEEILAPDATPPPPPSGPQPEPDITPPLESAETDDSDKDNDEDIGLVIEEEKEEEVPVVDEEVDVSELGKKMDELIQVEKDTGEQIKEVVEKEEEEELPDKTEEKMLELKNQIEKKREKVASTIKFMIKHDKLGVTESDINAKRVAGESIIFAKQRAQEDKMKENEKILLAASDEMIDKYVEEMKNNNEQKADNIFKGFFKNG